MLVNVENRQTTEHVEFISYTGKYPNLCGGILTLRIDGEEVTFGANYHIPTDHEKFWKSGGVCNMEYITQGEWLIDVEMIPEKYRKYASEIDNVFNVNVEYGCCGGCR